MEVPYNARVILAKYTDPCEEPTEGHFEYQECEYPLQGNHKLSQGQVIVKSLYLSVDPTMIRWIVGEAVFGVAGIGVIVKSSSDKFQVGDYVSKGMTFPWQLYFVEDDIHLEKLDLELIGGAENLSALLSCCGFPGLTVLIAIDEKGHLHESRTGTEKDKQVWVISGAAGSCGSLAGQIVQLECGEREVEVIGICGSDDKCSFLKEIGFHKTINYKKDDVGRQLDVLCPDGIDRYFDNVGGDVSDAVVSKMNKDGHIILCGQISEYSKGIRHPFPCSSSMQKTLNERCITRDKFLVLDYPEQYEKNLKKLSNWYINKNLKVRECFEEGLEIAPLAFIKMMTGRNIGKQLVRVTC